MSLLGVSPSPSVNHLEKFPSVFVVFALGQLIAELLEVRWWNECTHEIGYVSMWIIGPSISTLLAYGFFLLIPGVA